MKSMLRMSEAELASAQAGSGLAAGPAIGVAATSSALALAGLMLRYSPGDDVPFTGMDHLAGQALWAAALGVSMLAGAYLVRNLFMKRLQWGVLASLMLHLGLCGALNVVTVDVPLAMAAEIGDADRPPRDITMPDYGGMETESNKQQKWEKPTDVDVPESEQQQMERQESEIEFDSKIDPVEIQREVAEAAVPDRQQQPQERLEREKQLELEKQQQDAQADAPQQVEAPKVETADADRPDLEARDTERAESEMQASEKQPQEIARQESAQLSAAEMSRAEVRPENNLRPEATQQQREAAEARAAESMVNDVQISAAADARQVTADAVAVDAARQTQADLASESRPDNPNPFTSPDVRITSAAPSRANNRNTADSTPSSGGAASMRRSTSDSGSNTSAASAAAQSVNVASATGASSPSLKASKASSDVARGSSQVPTGASSGGGAPAMTANPFGIATVQSGTVGRSRGSKSGPEMGDNVAALAASGNGQRSTSQGDISAGAAGARAAEVSVGGAAAGNDAAGQMLAAGPSSAASGVLRNGQGLPGSRGNTGRSSATPSGGTADGMTIAMNTGGRSGLTVRATDPSARLGRVPLTGSSDGKSGPSGSGRQSAAASLPTGMLQAERSGALVTAGPQAPSKRGGGSGNLAGPRIGSLSRRSASLPGSGRGSVSVARSSPGLPRGLGTRPMPARTSTGAARPKLATAGEVAALINRTVPGISPIPSERISAGFSMRAPEARKEAVGKLGGSDASEAAVERALEWISAHQYAAGNWSIHDPNCVDHTCSGTGTYKADAAATGLSLLTFLGAGHTHRSGDYQQQVQMGLNWLIANQSSDGNLFPTETKFVQFYGHGMAAIALCEAYGMTKDKKLKQPAQKAIHYIVNSQHPEFGGWRYEPQFESDTSVSGWQLMALKSGEMAGLNVPKPAYAGVATWLDTVEDDESPGRFSYHPTKPITDSMTAEGLLMRQYLGAGREDGNLQAGASYLKSRLPRQDARDVYYWYYATQVMFHMQGDHWDEWNNGLRDLLVQTQDKAGSARGSWDPVAPTKDTWGQSGGRHYVTCLNVLMLEVYYRHLPLYIELNREP